MFAQPTGNLDCRLKFPINMAQNKGKFRKVHAVKRN